MNESDSKRLIDRAQSGNDSAAQELLRRYRDRLKRMVVGFLDPRVQPRLDASDIVQETLACAAKRLAEFDPCEAGGFYRWLRQIAKERIIDAHRRHIHASKRSVTREEPSPYFSSESTARIANRLVSAEPSPSEHLDAREHQKRLRRALNHLSDQNRELLLMRFVEQLRMREIAEVLCISESAAKSRLGRAIAQLAFVINEPQG